MKFTLELDPRAIQDIQEAIDYYDEQLVGLGEKFEAYLNKYMKSLSKNPFFQIRYDSIRCLPLKKYPYMIHFTVDEKLNTVYIHSVLNTARDPKEYWI
ncbi:MAG: type II toxin-antitoxin system RelE/ParE family toxin [Crocinitomicaceae bacterium]|nr:type II toxin-antitoxin system RelE/ParE family toxin [Crocinitomicaceae bacterium]